MTAKILLLPLVSACLIACGQGGSAAEASAVQPTASAANQPMVQMLDSRDGKIRIMIENGHFNDVLNDAALHPTGMSENELTLLQYDANAAVTLYAGDLGEAQSDAKTYFAKLKTELESASDIENLRVGIATDNRMNYQFTQPSSDGLLTENCLAIHESRLYTVCAASPTASAAQLAAVLKDVQLVK